MTKEEAFLKDFRKWLISRDCYKNRKYTTFDINKDYINYVRLDLEAGDGKKSLYIYLSDFSDNLITADTNSEQVLIWLMEHIKPMLKKHDIDKIYCSTGIINVDNF